MNTITRIENALMAIDQASFQTLVNHLLHLQGYKFIGAPGAVVGKEKTSKGTPDSFFVNDDKYTFVECTTRQRLGESKSFFTKLSKDIDHCFNEAVTTIKQNVIDKIILACNEKISTEEYNLLNTKVKSYNSNAKFEVLNIQNLPLLIFDIPKLAEEYLEIQIVKGDIYTLEQFLLKTRKGLQPSLTNEFIGREEELKNSIEALEKYNILLLLGGAGVGKSKLAVKILEELSKKEYIPIVIQSSGVSLWDDYQHLFIAGKQHIILFDDANKSITNLNYLLNKLEAPQSYSVKIIVTSRDYVKKQVLATLDRYSSYKEFNIAEFKDEEIEKIIVAALPKLQFYGNIKRKIVDLAKGNARVALMATYSVTPDSETNYLSSPVLLYEKYFKKISEDISIFDNPIFLKSLAIISFFGVLDRNNEALKSILCTKFEVDWNDIWAAIIELHNSEIVDVYAEEIVKVSDQVLATYAFYKCFIGKKSAIINYAEWITAFLNKFSNRIRNTLVDTNNTFVFYHVRDLVIPHLNEVLKQIISDEQLYDFYNLFWFYKGRSCLLYLKKWIEGLPQEKHPESFKFSYVHNEHTKATKYFELLKNFWNHPNELLKPSLELILTLLNKEPSRLPEILKFIHEDFKYIIEDRENEYLRQNLLLDILLDDKLNESRKTFANGIFLNIAEALLGWHYTEFRSANGSAFTIYNFDLYKSDTLMKLRERILNQVYHLFKSENKQSQKILNKIIYSGGDIDKSIYIDELPIYQKLIYDRLDNKQYAHCKFVSVLAKHFTEAGIIYPKSWNGFIKSDIKKLTDFLISDWEYREGKSVEESENERKQKLDDYVKTNDWQNLKRFLLDIDTLYKQQKDNYIWHIESSLINIYIFIAKKDKIDFENALRLFFSGKVLFPLRTSIINVALLENIMTGEVLLRILNDYEFQGKSNWESVLVALLPEDQVNESFLVLLIDTFQKPDEYIYIHRMLDYLKYERLFSEYKKANPELKEHNIITYLTNIVLNRVGKSRRNFGFNFCKECASYFPNFLNLLKDAYLIQYETEPHFDYNGKELKAILDLDKNFINESLKNGKIGIGFSSVLRLESINTSILWEYEKYEELIEDLLLTTIEKEQYISLIEEDIYSLFKFRNGNENRTEQIKSFIIKLTQKHISNEKIVLILIEVIYHNFNNWFIDFFRKLLLINKDFTLVKNISFGRSESWSGSKVPLIQKKIEFYQDVLKMINGLPKILEYSEHIDYFEQKINLMEKEIQDEQRRDFIQEFY